MLAEGPTELMIGAMPAVIVLVIVLVLVYAVRRKPSKTNGLATISLVLGITAIAFHVLFGTVWSNLLGPVAVITGAIALVQIGRQGGRGKWAAIAGIALGTLPFILTLGAILLLSASTF